MPAAETHLVLVGMMGSGKTSLGRRLARRLQWRHVDADKWIERLAGKTIPQIFADDGEAAFRDLEHDVLRAVLAGSRPCVVSTGGGAVLRPANRVAMRQRGTVV